jgi:hypothetical protein
MGTPATSVLPAYIFILHFEPRLINVFYEKLSAVDEGAFVGGQPLQPVVDCTGSGKLTSSGVDRHRPLSRYGREGGSSRGLTQARRAQVYLAKDKA